MTDPWRNRYRKLWRAYSTRIRSDQHVLERLQRTEAELDELRQDIEHGLAAAEHLLRERGFTGPPLELPIDIVTHLAALIDDPSTPPGYWVRTEPETE